MANRQQELERIGAERLAASRAADRDARFALLKCAVGCVSWCIVGMVGLGLAMHTRDEKLGWIYFWGGMVVGYAGMFATLHSYYLSGVERGDWQ
jgi:hypothetical protein